MEHPLLLRVSDETGCVFEGELKERLDLGRQRKGEEPPYALKARKDGQPARLVIAWNQEDISRTHLNLEPLPGGTVRITNHGQKDLEVTTSTEDITLPPEAALERGPSFTIHLGPRSVVVRQPKAEEEGQLRSLGRQTQAPGTIVLAAVPAPLTLRAEQVSPLLGWLQTTLGVLQSAVGSADFQQLAVEALVKIVGLDTGRFLRFEGAGWKLVSAYPALAEVREPSRHVLECLRKEKKTFWKYPGQAAPSVSLQMPLVVAAPILDRDRAVLGALYGERREQAPDTAVGEELVALLVELLACGLANGLARRRQEQEAIAAQVRFAQFFTPELAEQLAHDQDFMKGSQREVTLLFCDIRHFSRISEKLGPAETVRWINEVLEELSRCVRAREGVLVDYIGDELLAMWGAPRDQENHAERAVQAALDMVEALQGLAARWRQCLGEDMDLGIGLNTGKAFVGNIGCSLKFKYGPLGHAANLASRIQGLTKYLSCRVLVSDTTWEAVRHQYLTRWVCRARVVNIARPVDLYEVERPESGRSELFRLSEEALKALEPREPDFLGAARKAQEALSISREDGPALLTMARAAHMLIHRTDPFDFVWEAPGK